IGARNNLHGFGTFALVDDPWDYNKDRLVDPFDQIFARNSATGFTTRLELFTAPAAAPLLAEFVANEPPSNEPISSAVVGQSSATEWFESLGTAVRPAVRNAHAIQDERIWE